MELLHGATSLLQLAEGCLLLCPALADGLAILRTLLSGTRASKGLTALRAARLEPDAGKKAKALASAMKELKHPNIVELKHAYSFCWQLSLS